MRTRVKILQQNSLDANRFCKQNCENKLKLPKCFGGFNKNFRDPRKSETGSTSKLHGKLY